MTSSYTQLRKDAPRLVAMHSGLIKPGAAMWRKAEAERRFRQRHFFALESEQWHVAGLSVNRTCELLGIHRTSLLGPRRIKDWKNARHIAMTVAYELSGLSTIALGKLFNRTRHMILHAQRRVNCDAALRAQADKVVAAVRKELKCQKT